MKSKFKIGMLLLLGAMAINGLKAMQTAKQERVQTKTTTCAQFLYKHPWVSSVAAHAGAFALAWRFKGFKNFVKEAIEDPLFIVPFFVTVPTGATISKRYGHKLLVSSETSHCIKSIRSICSTGCKGQYEDLTEMQTALKNIGQQQKQLDEQEKEVIKNYKNKKYNF
jgi:hypothetical protein